MGIGKYFRQKHDNSKNRKRHISRKDLVSERFYGSGVTYNSLNIEQKQHINKVLHEFRGQKIYHREDYT